MKVFPSALGNIYSGDINDGLTTVMEELRASSVFIIADENTIDLCVPKLQGVMDIDHIILTKSGEVNKTLETCQSIWNALMEGNADKNALVLNVGGGVICDMGGFAAACYQRGIRFGHIPTTLLSMADAAIGGKLGIDYKGFKNYIGLIQLPGFVWMDKSFLNTLSALEKVSGLAEIVKHAIIGSPALWNLLSEVNDIEGIMRDDIFDQNVAVKVRIVESDPLENGYRKVLNFGHTIGHALESYFLTSGPSVTHGQCVALGMMAESKLAYEMSLLNRIDFEAIIELILRLLNPPVSLVPDFSQIRSILLKDKKKSFGRVGFSLPDGIGTCRWNIPVNEESVAESFDWLRTQVKAVPFRLNIDK